MIAGLLALDLAWQLGIVAGVVLACAVFGAFLGSLRNRKALGAVLGALLGPVGWLLLFLVRPDYVPCPECGALAHPRWARCPGCRCDLQRALQRSSNSQQRAARAQWR